MKSVEEIKKEIVEQKKTTGNDFYVADSSKAAYIKEIKASLSLPKVYNEVNNLISAYNGRTIGNYDKYGDYSSHTQQYSDFTSRANNLLKQLDGFKGLISEDDYKSISDTLNSIATNSDTQKKTLQGIIDFYGKFEDENQYNAWIEKDKKEQKALKEDAGALQTELDGLNNLLSEAEKIQANIDTNTNRGDAFKKRSAGLPTDGGNSSKANQYKKQLNDLLSKYGYSNLSELEKIVSEKQKYYDYVSNLQTITRLSNVTNPESEFYDPDCEKYISLGKEHYESTHIKRTDNTTVTNVNFDQKGYYPSNAEEYQEKSKELYSFQYENMDDDERRIYHYWLGRAVEEADGGSVNDEIAEKYVSYIDETIKYRRGKKVAENAKGNILEQYLIYGAAAIEGYFNEIKDAFDTKSDYIPGSVLSFAKEQVRKDLENVSFPFWYNIKEGKWEDKAFGSSLGQIGGDLIYNAAHMAPTIALSYVPYAGPYLALASTAISAHGGAYKEKLNEGYTKEQARTYATLVGVSEAALQYFIGGISKLGGKHSVSSGITNLVNKLDNVYVRAAVKLELSSNAEGLEEGLQRFLEPVFHSLATGETFEAPEWNDILYDGFIGKMSGYMFEGSTVISEVRVEHQMSKIGSVISDGNNVETVLMAAEYMGSLDPEIKGQVQALNDYNKTGKNGKTNAAYKRTLGKVAATVAENVTEVKQSVTEKAVSNELKNRGVDSKTIGKVSKIVSKFLSGQKLSSSEQGYLQHNSVAATVMQEIKVAQEQVKTQALASSPTGVTPSTQSEGAISSNAQSSAPQWAVDLVNKLTTIDSAIKIVNLFVSGKPAENTHDSEVNRMIKILSIASGKTTAEQEAEAGDIPYSQYIKEAAAQKENTAENGGETSLMENVDGENIITMDMPDSERAEILENTTIEVVEYDSNDMQSTEEAELYGVSDIEKAVADYVESNIADIEQDIEVLDVKNINAGTRNGFVRKLSNGTYESGTYGTGSGGIVPNENIVRTDSLEEAISEQYKYMLENSSGDVSGTVQKHANNYDKNHNDTKKSPLSDETVEELKNTYKSKAQGILKALCEKFGIFKDYSNDNVSLEFNYSRGSLNESVHKQNERGGDFSDFAKMLSLFDDIVSNAQPIECHSDKYVGTKRENKNLKQVYVLLSAFSDGQHIIPVEFNIKEFIDETNNQLYVSVTLNKIEVDLMGTPSEQNSSYRIPKSTSIIEADLMETPSNAERSTKISKSTSIYSLPQIIENINPSDGEFLKYIPDELLNEEQLQSKNEALEREETRLENMRNDYLRSTVSEETVAKRKKSVEKLTKLFGLGLEWSESVKRGKYNPNSRTVVLNPNLTLREMYLEVLKHEFTHDLENRKLYTKFKNFLFESSKSFIEFCEQRMKELTGETIKGRNAVYALRGEVYMAYKKSKELTEDERNAFNRESAEREMVCDFVAKKLLAEENEEAAIEALTELAENQPTIWERFTQWLQDIIFRIKHSHNKTDSAHEIEYLERLLKRVYDSKVDKNKTSNEVGNKHYIEYNVAEENTHVIELLNRIKQGNFKPNELVYFKNISDNIAEKIYNETGIDVKGFKVAIEARQLEHILKDHGIQGKTDHSMSSDRDIAKIEYVLDSPNEISYSGKTQAYSSFINGYNRTADTVLYEKEIGDKSYYVVQAVPVTKKKTLFIVSAFIGEKGYKKETLRLNNAKSPVATSQYDSAKVSNNSVSQNDTTVNSDFMQDIENYSIDLEENVSNGDYSIPTETTQGNKYSYQALISKPDMEITTVDDSVEYIPTAENRKNVVNEAVKNAASVGRNNENGNAVVYVDDINTEIIVPKRSMVHGLDRRFGVQAPVLVKIGEILKNSIQINELVPRSFDADNTYALISTANGDKGLYIISFIVNKFSNEVAQIDVLYSVNAKKESAALLPKFTDKSAPPTDSTISISDLLDLVNRYFPDVLPEDVLRHYGHTSRPDGEIGKSALYSIDMEAEEKSGINSFPDLMAVITDRYKRGELTDEEYRIEVQDLLLRANEKYGSIEPGEKAENKTSIPKRVTSDKSEKTKRWVRTVHESGILPEDMEVELEARILRDAESYQIIDDKAAQRQANLAIERGTAAKEWEAAVNGDGRVGKREIAIGETLLKLAAERKDNRAVMKLIAEVSEMGTRAGQIVQAMSMLKKMDGVGQLYYVQKCVERINRDLDKRFARKVKKGKLDSIPQVKINETLANQLAASKTQQDFEVTLEAMLQSIAEQVPTTFLDKWNAWRYFAMLFNPRTHIRNFGGNLGFLPTVRFKDLLAASIEKIILGEEQRTKSVIVKKEYRKFAEEDYPEIEAIITGGGKMNPSDEIRDRQNVFDPKWLEKLRKWNFDKLEKEDAYFLKKHYAHALGGFLQARNIDITKDIDSGVMEQARKYAMQEAQKATYRDASAITDILQRSSRTKSQVWNSIVEGTLPFKKTPINIVRRGIEYSPIGLIKTLTKGTVDLVNEKITASQFIDGIAGGLTGTGIVLLGALLSSLGFIKITGGFDDDEEDDINRLLGRQEYAVEIAGVSYTIDWMAPVCIPLFMGVEIQNALEEEGNGNLWNSIKNVGINTLEPIINLSMLSGMQDIISSAKYSEGSAVVGSVLWNIVLSYGTQAVPSIFGATARTIDGTRRTTYIDKTSWMSDMGQMALNKLESKVPFASMLRSEYVDEFGRTEDTGNVFTRAIQNFVSPGYFSKIEDDPVVEELKDLYEKTGESVLPNKPKKYIEVGGEKIYLKADEYEEYAKEVGQDRYDYVKEFINSSLYRTLTDAEKREVISDLYSYAQAKGKTHYSKYELPSLYTKVYEAERNGISPVEYYASKIATSVENADTDGSGTVTKKERLAAIRKMNVSNDIKAALIALYS